MGKCPCAVCSDSTSENVLFISRYYYIGTLSMTPMQLWPNDHSFRSFKAIWGHICFLTLTFDRIEIGRWGWSQYVSLAQEASTDMQYDLLVTTRDLTWPWPKVIFWFWPFKVSMYIFRHVSTRRTRCYQNYVTIFLSSKLFLKNHFRK